MSLAQVNRNSVSKYDTNNTDYTYIANFNQDIVAATPSGVSWSSVSNPQAPLFLGIDNKMFEISFDVSGQNITIFESGIYCISWNITANEPGSLDMATWLTVNDSLPDEQYYGWTSLGSQDVDTTYISLYSSVVLFLNKDDIIKFWTQVEKNVEIRPYNVGERDLRSDSKFSIIRIN